MSNPKAELERLLADAELRKGKTIGNTKPNEVTLAVYVEPTVKEVADMVNSMLAGTFFTIEETVVKE